MLPHYLYTTALYTAAQVRGSARRTKLLVTKTPHQYWDLFEISNTEFGYTKSPQRKKILTAAIAHRLIEQAHQREPDIPSRRGQGLADCVSSSLSTAHAGPKVINPARLQEFLFINDERKSYDTSKSYLKALKVCPEYALVGPGRR